MAKKKKSSAAGFALGAATALAVLGAYFIYGTKEGRNRKVKVKGWALKLRGEVLEEIEKIKNLNEDAYNAVLNNVTKRYRAMKNVDNKELEKVTRELRGYWKKLKYRFGRK